MEKRIVKLDSFNGLGIVLCGRKGHTANPDVFEYSIVVNKVNGAKIPPITMIRRESETSKDVSEKLSEYMDRISCNVRTKYNGLVSILDITINGTSGNHTLTVSYDSEDNDYILSNDDGVVAVIDTDDHDVVENVQGEAVEVTLVRVKTYHDKTTRMMYFDDEMDLVELFFDRDEDER